MSLDQLATGDWEPSVCKYGRFHSPLTRLPKEYRSTLQLDKRPICEIDVVNSQPFFLALLLRLFCAQGGIKSNLRAHLLEILSNHIPQSLRSNHEHHTYMFIKKIEFYQRLTSSGTFYEAMTADAEWDREAIKKSIFRDVLFGRNQIDNPLKREFTRRFPAVAEFVALAKRDDHRKLAHMLQRLESFVMIDTVCGRLMKDHPEIPVLTIHDSILTPQEHAECVVSTIHDVFDELVGLRPTLTIRPA